MPGHSLYFTGSWRVGKSTLVRGVAEAVPDAPILKSNQRQEYWNMTTVAKNNKKW